MAASREKYAAAVKKGATLVEISGPDGEVPSVDLVVQRERLVTGLFSDPGLFVDLLQSNRGSIVQGRADIQQVPREIPDHVGTRYPCG